MNTFNRIVWGLCWALAALVGFLHADEDIRRHATLVMLLAFNIWLTLARHSDGR